MKKVAILLVVFCLSLTTQGLAQVALDPLQFVNTQILADTLADGSRANTVYTVERGQAYAFDGTLSLDFRLEIKGPDNGAIIQDTGQPAVIVNTPDASSGAARQFFTLVEGGELVLENLIMSGIVSTGEVAGTFVRSTAGSLVSVNNVVFSDWQDFLIRVSNDACDIKATNCVWINGYRLRYSPWGAMPFRIEAAGNITIENNTVINASRVFTNGGPFLNTSMTLIHNTFLNMSKNAHEMQQYEFIAANNLYYNHGFVGFGPNQLYSDPPDWYQMHFVTSNRYTPVKDQMDDISCYLGVNSFYREPEIVDWFAAHEADTLYLERYWETHPGVDSCVANDDNFTFGVNYEGFDPGFTVNPTKTAEMIAWVEQYYGEQLDPRPDYRTESVVTFDATTGAPQLSGWPVAFDLSYSNEYLQTAGSDGLPIGDLNWFPTAKADYDANRAQYVAALQDSVNNAKVRHVAGSERSPFITPEGSAVDENGFITPATFSLEQNYPNPFNPSTNIQFSLVKTEKVSLKIFNTSGQLVQTVLNGKQHTAGSHTITVDMSRFSTGVYYYTVQAGNLKQTRKMVFMK